MRGDQKSNERTSGHIFKPFFGPVAQLELFGTIFSSFRRPPPYSGQILFGPDVDKGPAAEGCQDPSFPKLLETLRDKKLGTCPHRQPGTPSQPTSEQAPCRYHDLNCKPRFTHCYPGGLSDTQKHLQVPISFSSYFFLVPKKTLAGTHKYPMDEYKPPAPVTNTTSPETSLNGLGFTLR